MKTKVIKESVYKTEKVKRGEVNKTIYIAIDGKEFPSKHECVNYEKKLSIIKEGGKYITNIDFESNSIISSLLFDGCNVTSAEFFRWTYTNNVDILKKVNSYLEAKGCSIYESELEKFEKGDKVLICSWIEDEHSDYPCYETKAMKYEKAVDIVDELLMKLKSSF